MHRKSSAKARRQRLLREPGASHSISRSKALDLLVFPLRREAVQVAESPDAIRNMKKIVELWLGSIWIYLAAELSVLSNADRQLRQMQLRLLSKPEYL